MEVYRLGCTKWRPSNARQAYEHEWKRIWFLRDRCTDNTTIETVHQSIICNGYTQSSTGYTNASAGMLAFAASKACSAAWRFQPVSLRH